MRVRLPILLICLILCSALNSGCSVRGLERGFNSALTQYLDWHGVELKSVRLPMGQTLRYLESGDPDRPTLLLLHGFGADPMTTWLDLMPQFKDHFHLLAPVMLYATNNPSRPVDYMPGDERQMLEEFAARLGLERLSLVGMSCGACVAVDLALRRPDLVDRLALIALPTRDIAPVVAEAQAQDRLPELYKGLFYRPPPLPGFVLNAQVERIQAMGERFGELLERIDLGCHDARRSLSRVQQPVLIAWGVRDRLFPLAEGRALAREFPRADFEFFMESGHAVTWDQPQRLGEAIDNFMEAEPTP